MNKDIAESVPTFGRARYLRTLLLVAALISFVRPAWADSRAGNLLSAETDVIVTFNAREVLRDYREIPHVQTYLDQWRLALQGSEKQLLQYYESQEILRYEGISPKEFLERAQMIKAAFDAIGCDPFEDVERITVGFAGGAQGFLAMIVEGKFPRQNLASLEQFFRQHLFPVNQGDCPSLSFLDEHTLVIADSQKTMEATQRRVKASKVELPVGVQTLLECGAKKHLSVLVNNVKANVERLTKFVHEELASSIGVDHSISKFVAGPGTDWIKTVADTFAAVSFSVSARDDKLRLEFGLDAVDAATAEDQRRLINIGSFLGVQLFRASDHEVAAHLAGILDRLRVSLKQTTLIVEFDLPNEFTEKVRNSPSFDVFPDAQKVNASPQAFPGEEDLRSLVRQATSIPLWKSEVASSDIEQVLDVPYQTGPGADPFRHRLDMFLPKNSKKFPIVVLIHGGGWDQGDNRCSGLYSSVGQFLASQGIGVALPNYRLSPTVKHPEHIKDVAAAVAWTQSHAGQYGGDAGRIFLIGHSAGGHLVSLLAADVSYLQAAGMRSGDIKGVITLSGVYRISDGVMYGALAGSGPRALRLEQMLPLRGESNPFWKWHPPGVHVAPDIFGTAFGDSAKQRADASPITHVHRDMPPFLILSPEYDLPSLCSLADEFHVALRDKGCEVRLLRVPKRNHNSLMFSVITPQDPVAKAILEFVLKSR